MPLTTIICSYFWAVAKEGSLRRASAVSKKYDQAFKRQSRGDGSGGGNTQAAEDRLELMKQALPEDLL
jgi:hypothetical protein